MFIASSQLKRGKPQQLFVESAVGHILMRDEEKVSRIRAHYQGQYNTSDDLLPPPAPHTLETPVSTEEVEAALRRLRSQKACGPHGVCAELLEYGADTSPRSSPS